MLPLLFFSYAQPRPRSFFLFLLLLTCFRLGFVLLYSHILLNESVSASSNHCNHLLIIGFLLVFFLFDCFLDEGLLGDSPLQILNVGIQSRYELTFKVFGFDFDYFHVLFLIHLFIFIDKFFILLLPFINLILLSFKFRLFLLKVSLFNVPIKLL